MAATSLLWKHTCGDESYVSHDSCGSRRRRAEYATASHTIRVEPASRKVYMSTPAQVLLGEAGGARPPLRNAAGEGTLCLAPVAFRQRAWSALQASIHALGA